MNEKKEQVPKPEPPLEKADNTLDQWASKMEELDQTNKILLAQIMELSKSVYGQSNQLKQTQSVLLKEFEQLRRVPNSKALGTIIYKLFGEILEPINQLDDLLDSAAKTDPTKAEENWISAMQILRNQLENILAKWDCRPIIIVVEKEEFDPEYHQAVESDQALQRADLEDNIILKVMKRGWHINQHIIQYPQVVVNIQSS